MTADKVTIEVECNCSQVLELLEQARASALVRRALGEVPSDEWFHCSTYTRNGVVSMQVFVGPLLRAAIETLQRDD